MSYTCGMGTKMYTLRVGEVLGEALKAVGRERVRSLLCNHFGVTYVPTKLGRPPKKKFQHPAFMGTPSPAIRDREHIRECLRSRSPEKVIVISDDVLGIDIKTRQPEAGALTAMEVRDYYEIMLDLLAEKEVADELKKERERSAPPPEL